MHKLAATLAAVVVFAAPSVAEAAPAHHHVVKAHAAELSPWDIFSLIDSVMKTINEVNVAAIRNLS